MFLHCMFPVIDAMDRARMQSATLSFGERMNDVTDVFAPRIDKVNVCTHRVSECSCMARYAATMEVHFTLAHSAYYLTEREWGLLAAVNPSSCYMTVHPPSAGRGIPSDSPEFTFDHPSNNTNVLCTSDLVVDAYREYMLGRPAVVFKPNGPHGTMYHHDSMIWHNSGGFHSSVLTRAIDGASRDWRFCCLHVLLILASLCFAAYMFMHGLMLIAEFAEYCINPPNPSRLAQAFLWAKCKLVTCSVPALLPGLQNVAIAILATIGTWWHMLLIRACMALTVAPGTLTDLTLSLIPGRAFDHQGEAVCDVFKVVFTQPITLNCAGPAQPFHVHHEAYANALTILAMGSMGPPKQMACLATIMRRHNVASPVAYRAVNEATNRLNVYRALFEAPTTLRPSFLSLTSLSPGLILRLPYALGLVISRGLQLVLPLMYIVLGIGVCVVITWGTLHGIPLVYIYMASHSSGATGWPIA